jgi:hypothetical protein
MHSARRSRRPPDERESKERFCVVGVSPDFLPEPVLVNGRFVSFRFVPFNRREKLHAEHKRFFLSHLALLEIAQLLAQHQLPSRLFVQQRHTHCNGTFFLTIWKIPLYKLDGLLLLKLLLLL